MNPDICLVLFGISDGAQLHGINIIFVHFHIYLFPISLPGRAQDDAQSMNPQAGRVPGGLDEVQIVLFGAGVNYRVELEMERTPEGLRWGMTAFVDIEVNR